MGMVPFGAPAGGAAPPGYPPSAAPPAFGHHAGLGPAQRPGQVKLPHMYMLHRLAFLPFYVKRAELLLMCCTPIRRQPPPPL